MYSNEDKLLLKTPEPKNMELCVGVPCRNLKES